MYLTNMATKMAIPCQVALMVAITRLQCALFHCRVLCRGTIGPKVLVDKLGGSRISGKAYKGVLKYKSVGVCFADFISFFSNIR